MKTSSPIAASTLGRIYQMKSANDFALGLVSVFIPIYLLDLGYSLTWVFSWWLVLFTTFSLAIFCSVYSTNKIGFIYTFYIRFLFLLSHLGLLLALPNHQELFYVIAILAGVEWAFFWMPFNILFVRNTSKDKTGSALSKLSAYPAILTMFSPLVGAFIIEQFNFPTLFVVAMIIVLSAVTFLLPLRSEKTDFKFHFKHVGETYRKYRPFFKSEIIARLAEDTGFVWSIFVYLQLANKFDVGIVATISGIVGILFVLTLGKLTDDWDKHRLFKIGAISVSLAWFINFTIGITTLNPWLFYLATLFMGLALKTFLIPYRTILWNSGRNADAQFIVLREIPSYIGRVILFSLAIIFYENLAIVFLITSIVFLYFVFYDSRKLEIA